MAITQSYVSQVLIGTTVFPVLLGSASLSHDRNIDTPPVAGNYGQINYAELMRMPMVSAGFALLDGDEASLMIASGNISQFIDRGAAPSNDVSEFVGATASTGIKFWDGKTGWKFPHCKGASFTISGSKNASVQFSANFMAYAAASEISSGVAEISSAPASAACFSGNPITYANCSFFKNGSSLAGVYSWDITFNNNMTPDLSMETSTGQSQYPVDVNAGLPTASLRVVFQADHTSAKFTAGDTFGVLISHGGTATRFTVNNFVPVTDTSRSIGTGRQMRPYQGNAMSKCSTGTFTGPITIATS